MFNNNYQSYFDEYHNFQAKNSLGARYLEESNLLLYFSNNCQILKYNADFSTDKVFLIVPSIFNSPEILFINKNKSFIKYLKQLGDVYLINWLEIHNADYSLNDYVFEISKVLNFLAKTEKKQINLLGHCIGGNLAIAAGIIKQDLVKTLMLMTAPWDFSHFIVVSKLHQHLNLDQQVKDMVVIPKIYIQILFFLLYPEFFSKKINKFFNLNSEQDRGLFFAVEHWLMSGHSIPQAAYFQIIEDLLIKNLCVQEKWIVGDKIITPQHFTKPVCQIIADGDKIVPAKSILFLHNRLKNSKIFKVNGGHISYLIDHQIELLIKNYKNWLSGENL